MKLKSLRKLRMLVSFDTREEFFEVLKDMWSIFWVFCFRQSVNIVIWVPPWLYLLYLSTGRSAVGKESTANVLNAVVDICFVVLQVASVGLFATFLVAISLASECARKLGFIRFSGLAKQVVGLKMHLIDELASIVMTFGTLFFMQRYFSGLLVTYPARTVIMLIDILVIAFGLKMWALVRDRMRDRNNQPLM